MKILILLSLFLNIFLSNLWASKTLYLSYKKIPNSVYENQRFEVKLEALVTSNTDLIEFYTKINSYDDIEILNPNSVWKKISSNKYENSFYLKVKSPNFTLPTFEVSIYKLGNLVDSSVLELPNINFSNIGKNDFRYSNIIAENIIIKAYKTKQYNNNSALTIIDLDAINSNLSDFHLKNIELQGISSIKEWENIENLVYYFVTPIYQKELIFTYLNSTTNSFKEVKIPLILQNELVSTQTDLNPNDSSFEKYKKIASIVIFFIFLVLFIWKKYTVFLLLTIFSLLLAVFYNMPNTKGFVKQDSYIYILPTKNSTIFFKTTKNEEVEILEKRENFVKVLGLENKFIGWVKEDNFEKN